MKSKYMLVGLFVGIALSSVLLFIEESVLSAIFSLVAIGCGLRYLILSRKSAPNEFNEAKAEQAYFNVAKMRRSGETWVCESKK